MRTFALLAVLLLACSKPAPVAERIEAGAPVATPLPAPEIDAAPLARTKHYSAAFAHFVKGNLFECIDMSVDFDVPADAGADWKPKKNPIDEAKKAMKEATPIDQPCGQAFADRPVLASCSYSGTSDAGSNEMSTSFYDFADIGLSDEQMADCLKDKGKWNALARTSPEWQRAKVDYDQRRLRGLAEKLGH